MLVRKPKQHLMLFKGYPVEIHSENHLEDSNKFEAVALELRVIMLDALGGKHANH